MTTLSSKPALHQNPTRSQVLSQAVLKAAGYLGLSQKDLAEVIGESESTISRLKSGRGLDSGSKAGELALTFVRVFRSLDTLMGGNTEASKQWIHTENLHLGGIPGELIKKAVGLVHVAEYLDAMRGKI